MIYSSVARALRDARGYATSMTQLKMLDLVGEFIADELHQYSRFNADRFKEEAELGFGVYVDRKEMINE
jgi:hypothetical protein